MYSTVRSEVNGNGIRETSLVDAIAQIRRATPQEIEHQISCLEDQIEDIKTQIKVLRNLAPGSRNARSHNRGFTAEQKQEIKQLVIQGRTPDEIAEITGFPVKSVRRSAGHIRSQLKQEAE